MRPVIVATVAVGVACAGCLSIPPPALDTDASPNADARSTDARVTDASVLPSLSPLSREMVSATRWRYGNATASIVLNSTQPFGLAELRSPGGSDLNLLYTGSTGTLERYSGVEMWPNWFSYTAAAGLSVTATEVGPALMRIDVIGTSGGMDIASTYTMHPDGRIHRWDRVSFNSTVQGWLVSYVSLECGRIDGVSWAFNGSPGGSAVLEPTSCIDDTEFQQGFNVASLGYVCAYSTTGEDVVGWAHHEQGIASGHPDALRISRTTDTVSLTSDWLRDVMPMTGTTYAAHALMVVNTLANKPAFNCESVAQHSASFQDPLVLSVTGPASLVTSGLGDDDADGYNEGGGFYQVSASGGVVAIDASGSTFAPTQTLLVNNFDASATPVVTLGGETLVHGADYLYQRTTDNSGMWLFLARPLGVLTLTLSEGS